MSLKQKLTFLDDFREKYNSFISIESQGGEYDCQEDGVLYYYRKYPDFPKGYKEKYTDTWQECHRRCLNYISLKFNIWHLKKGVWNSSSAKASLGTKTNTGTLNCQKPVHFSQPTAIREMETVFQDWGSALVSWIREVRGLGGVGLGGKGETRVPETSLACQHYRREFFCVRKVFTKLTMK